MDEAAQETRASVQMVEQIGALEPQVTEIRVGMLFPLTGLISAQGMDERLRSATKLLRAEEPDPWIAARLEDSLPLMSACIERGFGGDPIAYLTQAIAWEALTLVPPGVPTSEASEDEEGEKLARYAVGLLREWHEARRETTNSRGCVWIGTDWSRCECEALPDNIVCEEHKRQAKAFLRALVRKKGAAPQAKPLGDTLRYASNTVSGAAVRALLNAHNWPSKPIDGFAHGFTQKLKNLQITVGLLDAPDAESLWQYLCVGGVRMVKAHYALWARWYEESGNPGEFITININQICSDLGYTKHQNGGYRPQHKQEAVRILEAQFAIEMRATFTPPSKNAKPQRLRGPLWSRGLMAEEQDQYGDVFGQAREGGPNLWEPLAFCYAPGQWFTVGEYRHYNKAVGKIGSGLMRLDNGHDKWAILIGGYLGTLIRVERYQPRTSCAGTILYRTGLAQDKDARRRVSEKQPVFERALDRLAEVGVIESWDWKDSGAPDVEDMDDPDAIATYYGTLPKSDWRKRNVQITFPFPDDADRLAEAHRKAIAEASKAARRDRAGRRPAVS